MTPELLETSRANLVDELVTRSFGYPSGRRFFEDFPVWGSSGVDRLGLMDQGKLISHVGIRTGDIQTSKGMERVALIGAVATDERHRGRGFSSFLLQEALRRIEAAGCTWSFLWGSEHEFYAKQGFRLEGTQWRFLISDLSIPVSGLQSNPPHEGLNERIWSDLQARRSGIRFQRTDRDWVFAHRSVRWLSFAEPFSYVAYERGMDLKHIVHEAGGDPSGIQKLLYYLYLECPIAQIIGSEKELERLGFRMTEGYREHLCLARPMKSGTTWNPEFWVSGLSAC